MLLRMSWAASLVAVLVTRIASAESVNKCVPTSFDWDIAKSKLITNNLGGKGPDKDVPEEMYFQGIATLPNEHRLDLKITAIIGNGHNYAPQGAENGIEGDFGRIAVQTTKNASFKLAFIDGTTNKPVVLPTIALTIFDLDSRRSGIQQETLVMGGWTSYKVFPDTALIVESANNGDPNSMRFTAPPGSIDNPSDRLALTDAQMSRAVEFEYTNVDHIIIDEYTAIVKRRSKQGRNMFFAGRSSLDCVSTTTPSPTPSSTTAPITPSSSTAPITPSSTTAPVTPSSTTAPITPSSTTAPPTTTSPTTAPPTTTSPTTAPPTTTSPTTAPPTTTSPTTKAPTTTVSTQGSSTSSLPCVQQGVNFNISAAEVTINNLGGFGPDEGTDPVLYFKGVGRIPGSGNSLDISISVTGNYAPVFAIFNGKNGQLGSINMAADKAAGFNFSFIDGSTGKSVTLKDVELTIFDFDTLHDGKETETMLIKDYQGYRVEDNTELNVTKEASGALRITATSYGDIHDNPTDIYSLTDLQRSRSIGLEYSSASYIYIDEWTTIHGESAGSRRFLFAGRSSLDCAPVILPETSTSTSTVTSSSTQSSTSTVFVVPETTTTLPTTRLVTTLTTTPPGQSTSSQAKRCHPQGFDFSIHESSVVVNNLNGAGPQTDVDPVIRYSPVATLPNGTSLDLIVGASEDYAPVYNTRNGKYGHFGNINIAADRKVSLSFTFVRTEDSVPIELETLSFTFFDLDTNTGKREVETIVLRGMTNYTVSENSELKITSEPQGGVRFTATTIGTVEDNPIDRFELTNQQLARSVTVTYDHTASFEMAEWSTGNHRGGSRSLLFAGQSSLACSPSGPTVTSTTAGSADSYLEIKGSSAATSQAKTSFIANGVEGKAVAQSPTCFFDAASAMSSLLAAGEHIAKATQNCKCDDADEVVTVKGGAPQGAAPAANKDVRYDSGVSLAIEAGARLEAATSAGRRCDAPPDHCIASWGSLLEGLAQAAAFMDMAFKDCPQFAVEHGRCGREVLHTTGHILHLVSALSALSEGSCSGNSTARVAVPVDAPLQEDRRLRQADKDGDPKGQLSGASCSVDFTSAASSLLRAGSLIMEAVQTCSSDGSSTAAECSRSSLRVLAALSHAGKFIASSISDCDAGSNAGSQCTAEINNLLSSLSRNTDRGLELSKDCQQHFNSTNIVEVIVKAASPSSDEAAHAAQPARPQLLLSSASGFTMALLAGLVLSFSVASFAAGRRCGRRDQVLPPPHTWPDHDRNYERVRDSDDDSDTFRFEA